jgi:hypothetical protein
MKQLKNDYEIYLSEGNKTKKQIQKVIIHLKNNYGIYIFSSLIVLGFIGMFSLIILFDLIILFITAIGLIGLIIFGYFMIEEQFKGFSHYYYIFLLLITSFILLLSI